MLIVILLIVIVLLLVWELWVCEGAHLGQRFVVWLYDLAANRYDGIKQFDPEWENRFLGEPLNKILSGLPNPRLLDVGAGTARTFRALSDAPGSLEPGSSSDERLLVALEPSVRMMKLGRNISGPGHVWVRSWAVPLPVSGEAFDVVVSLEVLEFTPNPRKMVREIYRVLRPGGWALLTNRIGWQAPLILGHTVPRTRFQAYLEDLGFESVEVFPWQVDYDIAWARKPWT